MDGPKATVVCDRSLLADRDVVCNLPCHLFSWKLELVGHMTSGSPDGALCVDCRGLGG